MPTWEMMIHLLPTIYWGVLVAFFTAILLMVLRYGKRAKDYPPGVF